MRNKLLLEKGYLVKSDQVLSLEDRLKLNIKLLKQYGITISNPDFLSMDNFKFIEKYFGNNKKGFYNNPQDLAYFSEFELSLERDISYLKIEVNNIIAELDVYKRVELFRKNLPSYKEGKETVFRTFKMLDKSEVLVIIKEVFNNYKSYTRPFSYDEFEYFKFIYKGYQVSLEGINSRANIIKILKNYQLFFHDLESLEIVNLAKEIDVIDLVKLSIAINGDHKEFRFNCDYSILFKILLENAKIVPLSKKQAKYYNKLVSYLNLNKSKLNNHNNPMRIFTNLMEDKKIIEATKYLSDKGSLLERNLVWILSRSNLLEIDKVLSEIKVTNPIVLIQLLKTLNTTNEKRGFSFYNENRLKYHFETEYEAKWRKSIITEETKKEVKNTILKMVNNYYFKKDSLGNIYISEEFKKVAIPINTTATSSGLDVLPTGSRIKIEGSNLRAFVKWKGICDIDSSVIFSDELETKTLYWGNYNKKEFGAGTYASGDDRSNDGIEFIDFNLNELRKKGFKYGMYVINGYLEPLNKGVIEVGYQNKTNLHTKAWSDKNIALKIGVRSEMHEYVGFIIDISKEELIIINEGVNSNYNVVNSGTFNKFKEYLEPSFLNDFNMHNLLSLRGNVVSDINLANIIFDRTYFSDEKEVVRPYNLDKLITYLD